MTKCILVVDDNEDIRNTVVTLLKHEKYTVLTAANGDECLQNMRTKKNIDLILLDLKMPGLPIDELFAEFKKMDLKTKFVMFSASHPEETKETLEEGMAQGLKIADYIEKPFENKDFIARIKKALTS